MQLNYKQPQWGSESIIYMQQGKRKILFGNSKTNLSALQELLPLYRACLMQECNMQTCKDLKEAITTSKLHEIKQTRIVNAQQNRY